MLRGEKSKEVNSSLYGGVLSAYINTVGGAIDAPAHLQGGMGRSFVK